MTKNSYVKVRINDDLKNDVTRICDELGISISIAVSMFLKQVSLNQGLPFPVKLPAATIYTPETLESLDEAESGRLAYFDNIDDLKKSLEG